MKLNHRQLKKILAIVGASAAGVLVYLPASALVGSFGSNNNPSPQFLSQDLPSSPLPTITPSFPETPAPSPLPTLDVTPTPLPTGGGEMSTPTPLPTVDTIPTPLPGETPTPDVTPTTLPGETPTPDVTPTTLPEETPTPDVTPTPEVPSGTIKAPEKGSWACLNNPNPDCK